jgi:hypothetical protein
MTEVLQDERGRQPVAGEMAEQHGEPPPRCRR